MLLRVLMRRDGVPRDVWRELSDPLNFVVGALFLAVVEVKDKGERRDGEATRFVLSAFRLTGAVLVAVIVAVPVLLGIAVPKLDTGDASLYALTLLLGSVVALIPGRIRDLKMAPGYERHPKVRLAEEAYPRGFRQILWVIEGILIVAGTVTIVVWGFGGAGKNDELRAVVWGLVLVSAADFITLMAAVNFVTAKRLAELQADLRAPRPTPSLR